MKKFNLNFCVFKLKECIQAGIERKKSKNLIGSQEDLAQAKTVQS